MKKLRKVLLVAILIVSWTLSSCSNNGELNPKLPDIQGYENGIKSVNEYISCPIEDEFLEMYPYSDGYYGYKLESPLFIEMCSFFNSSIKMPRINMNVDERLLLYFQYDNETYVKAKEHLMKTLSLSDYPTKEYNGYVFYDDFSCASDKNSPEDFSYLVCNDNKNIIIILELYYSNHSNNNNSLYEPDYDWGEYMHAVFGQWYDFSQ